MVLFSKIEDVFRITGRGLVVAPGPLKDGVCLRTKDSIQLRTPEGRILDTHVAAIEFLCGPKVKQSAAFLLPADITEQDVPLGTEIWLTESK